MPRRRLCSVRVWNCHRLRKGSSWQHSSVMRRQETVVRCRLRTRPRGNASDRSHVRESSEACLCQSRRWYGHSRRHGIASYALESQAREVRLRAALVCYSSIFDLHSYALVLYPLQLRGLLCPGDLPLAHSNPSKFRALRLWNARRTWTGGARVEDGMSTSENAVAT